MKIIVEPSGETVYVNNLLYLTMVFMCYNELSLLQFNG